MPTARRIASLLIGLICAYAVLAAITRIRFGVPWRVHYLIYGDEPRHFFSAIDSLGFLSVFVPIVVLLLYWYLRRKLHERRVFLRVVIMGAAIGYVAGVIAFPFETLFRGHGFAVYLNSWRYFPDTLVIGLAAPLLYGCWLFGAIATGVTWLLLRKTATDVTMG